MAALNGLDFEGEFNNAIDGLFKNNITRDISPTDQRALVTLIRESYLNLLDHLIDEDSMATNSASKVPSQQSVKAYVDALLTTRAFQRAFSADLLFDKNEIEYASHTATGSINFTLSGGAHIVNQFSSSIQAITFDGSQSINFGAGITPLGIANGGVPEAGTFFIAFLYWNGTAIANFMGTSTQVAGAVQLAAPGSLAVVADGQTALDISWTNVTGNEGYLVEASVDGTSGWSTIETTAVDAVASTITGLSAGNTRYVRVTTLGNGTTTLDSGYATAAGSTSSGSVIDPTFTFSPVNAATGVLVNQQAIITANRAIRNTDGTALTNANIAAVIILKETNSSGTNITFTATIDSTKTIITISPTAGYGGTQLVYIAINNVEDNDGNEVTTAISSTFTTNNYTRLNGTSNYLRFGDILDSLFSTNDSFFKLRIAVNDMPLSGSRMLINKYSTSDNQRSFYWYTTDSDVYFTWSRTGTGASRGVKWSGVLTTGAQSLELEYNDAIDTNDGLDRCILRIGGTVQGSKSLVLTVNVLSAPFNSTAQLAFGAGVRNNGAVTVPLYYIEQAKDLQVLSVGDVVEINVPIIIEGTDTSGNARHGTWA